MMNSTVFVKMNALYLVDAIAAPNFKDMIIEKVCDLNRSLTL
ncbi:hypothetical protein ACHAL6_05000 [Proteiniclasticum sp. C24MP]